MVRTFSGCPSPLAHFSQLALCRNTLRSRSEPRRISPVRCRRSRSFWRARRVCSCIILITDTDSVSFVNIGSTRFCTVHGGVVGSHATKNGALLQFLRRSATDFAGVGRWNFAPESKLVPSNHFFHDRQTVLPSVGGTNGQPRFLCTPPVSIPTAC